MFSTTNEIQHSSILLSNVTNNSNNNNNNSQIQINNDDDYIQKSSSCSSNYAENLNDFIDELRQRTILYDDDIMIMNEENIDPIMNESMDINSICTSQQSSTANGNNDLLLIRLAKKEKDLILAAELGKALLDRNEELSLMNEKLNEEYTKNIEVSVFFTLFW